MFDDPRVLLGIALVVAAVLIVLHLKPLITGRPLPDWWWLRAPGRSWPPQQPRLSAAGRIVLLLGAALLAAGVVEDSVAMQLLAVVFGLTGAVLAAVGDGPRNVVRRRTRG